MKKLLKNSYCNINEDSLFDKTKKMKTFNMQKKIFELFFLNYHKNSNKKLLIIITQY